MKKNMNSMKYYKEVERVEPEIYYHYTSLEALYNIIKCRTLRLTNLISSNDTKELSYDSKDFIDDLKCIISVEENENNKKIFQIFLESIENNISKFKNNCKNFKDIYALCLSEKRDNLTHWDRYADRCKGVCIGINVNAFKVHAQRMNNLIFGGNLISNGKVIYNVDGRRKSIKSQIIGFINNFIKNVNIPKEDILSNIEENAYVYASAIFLNIKVFVKNSFFVDEDEVRLYHKENEVDGNLKLIDEMKRGIPPVVLSNIKKSYLKMVEDYNLNKYEYYMSKYGIRSFIELSLKEIWGSGLITEIILGPLCVQNIKELKKFINEYGLKGTKISVSDVPIR